MRLAPRTIALSFWALLFGALMVVAQSPIPVTPRQTSPASRNQAAGTKLKQPTKNRRKTPAKVATRETDPAQKVVVKHGGTREALPQMAPVATQHQDSDERRKAGQLLTATDSNLKSLLGRSLTADQQATVAQARQFMGQARTALDAGDLTQGYNLASKANTLSEELVKK